MKKVLIIASSPARNGNSDLLAQAFAEGATAAGNEVEIVYLRSKKIGYCRACNYCHSHNNTCVFKDDMAELLDKMKAADVYVFATPVYYYNVNAQMKTFIDRTYACFMNLADKELYYLASSTDTDRDSIDGAIAAFKGFEVCLPNAVNKGIVYGVGNQGHGEIKGKKVLKDAYDMGYAIA